jgi:K+-sensing histidine kinase KdpD
MSDAHPTLTLCLLIQEQTARAARHLKVFGASPGVGKIYAMLPKRGASASRAAMS